MCVYARVCARDIRPTRNANPFKHTLHKHTPLWLTKSHKFPLAASPLFPLPARAPNGKPHLLMPYTGPTGWQRHRHGELDSELQIMDLRLRELGREPAPAPAKHRMSMADLIVPAYSALIQTPLCIVNTAESSRAVERELLPLQMKGNGHINAEPC